jgi:hypothetical protein
MHIFHKWSVWSKPTEAYSSRKVQWAYCKICNKVKFRAMGYDGQVSVENINKVLDEVAENN